MSRRAILTRRELLLGLGAAVAGCDTRRPQQGALGAMDRFTGAAQSALFRPSHLPRTPGANALTPEGAFPQYKIGAAFPIAPSGWALQIGGMVARPQRLELAQLQKLARTEMRVRHHCVEGWSAVASWHGVQLAALATLAGADPSAGFVEFVSFEATHADDEAPDAKAGPDTPQPRIATYTSSWDRQSALHPQTMVAYGMNGSPLGLEHGGPARLYASVKLGYKMVKWLAAVNFMPRATGGYWEDQGYEWFAGV